MVRRFLATSLLMAAVLGGLVLPASARAGANPNPGVIPINATPYGMTYAQWTTRWWKWVEAIPASTNPLFDATGAHCVVGQTGPVWFLAGTSPGTVTRSCTVPVGKALLFPIVNLLNDYPCPDPTFQPGPGQSLQDFLTEGARAFVDQASSLEADVDGVSLQSLTTYRATTSLFTFTGDPSLTAVLDPCITGSPQPGVSDGYWIMLAPLSAGTHTIHFRGVVTFQDGSSFATEVTYRLKVGA